jgi:hypothetical protein
MLIRSHKTKRLQPGHKPVIKKAIIWPWGQSSKSNVTKHGTPHIILRWSTHMSNIKSLSHKTKKLQPGHKLVIKKTNNLRSNSRSKVINHSMQHIVLRWSTHMPNINSISRKTNKLQPGHKLVIEKAIIWPWGQSSRSPTMVSVTLSWGDLPACLISKAYLIKQKSYNPDTKLSLKKQYWLTNTKIRVLYSWKTSRIDSSVFWKIYNRTMTFYEKSTLGHSGLFFICFRQKSAWSITIGTFILTPWSWEILKVENGLFFHFFLIWQFVSFWLPW